MSERSRRSRSPSEGPLHKEEKGARKDAKNQGNGKEVKAVRDYPTPKNVRDVRAFVGLTSFYRRLVPNFAATAKPLTELTRKGRPFVWGPCQQKAFEEMKDRLCTTPVLAHPNFDLPFILTTDASKVAVAAILSQVQDGEEKPLAYGS
jgi:hypothetical protein